MLRFLVDVNLPYYFSLWEKGIYLHQEDLDNKAKDGMIWSFAKEKNLTIITKDSDFSNRVMVSTPPPKVIHLKIGNMRMKDMQPLLLQIWPQVLELNKDYKLVSIYQNRIEAIN